MAEINNHEEPTFSSKRKPDPNTQDLPNKAPKLATLTEEVANPNSNDNNSEVPTTANCSSEPDVVPKEGGADDKDNDNEPENDDDDSELENDEDEEEEEDSDGEAVVDRKGKGVLRDDKGKGKLIEEEDEDDDDSDDDDDDSGGSVSGGESDFSDDPLAEVDLNNILPSRTRRRTAQPGVHITSDTGNAVEDNDDSDDSDA